MEQFDWMGTFINWFPMVLIFGVWILFIRRMQGPGGYQYKLLAVQKDMAEAFQKQNETLERIAAALEKRSP
jgi:ATP-dependent Zn protease